MANYTVSTDVDTLLQSSNFAAIRNNLTLGTAQSATHAALTLAKGTITSDAQILTRTATWNNAGVSFVASKTNITDTTSAAESQLETWQVGGVDKFSIRKDGSPIVWNAPGTNYERLRAYFSSNVAYVISEVGGSGTARNLVVGTSGAASTLIRTNGTNRWETTSSGHLLAVADNSYDIGATGATRPRTVYAGTGVSVGSSGSYAFESRSMVKSSADGLLTLLNAAGTGFTRLCFGGTSASEPAIKVSGTGFKAVLANDSGNTTWQMKYMILEDGITAPSTVAGVASIYIDTADGDLKIKYGDGTTKTIVVDT